MFPCVIRLILFADSAHPADGAGAVSRLCGFLSDNPQSPLQLYANKNSKDMHSEDSIDGFLDIRAVYQQNFRDIELESLLTLLMPQKGVINLIDYEKVFCADAKCGSNIFDMRGVNREQGCMVVVRPGQHVSAVFPLDACQALSAFFDGFMIANR